MDPKYFKIHLKHINAVINTLFLQIQVNISLNNTFLIIIKIKEEYNLKLFKIGYIDKR